MTPCKNLLSTNAFNKTNATLCALLFFCLTLHIPLLAQNYDSLIHLDGYQTKIYYSNGTNERAKTMAIRCDKVLQFYKKQIEFEPSVTLLILSPQDWSKYTSFPVYGMPHYNDKKTLIVASEDNDFWKSFIPPISQLPKKLADQITSTYSNKSGGLTMQAFFDLLAIHELGHAYHSQGKLTMQRKWMSELFANILLHTYIAENEPDLLPALTIFPKMVVAGGKSEFKFTNLKDLETNYNEIGQKYPKNYGWYQCRWHIAAGNIYDAGKIETFKKLWVTLQSQIEILDDASFASLLTKNVHQSVADVLLKWDE
ncbi:MAG TPA: hypothetical protein VK498_08455 [Ferruginibacter sp.]|nr:hypothetical protein [Ferruginibacter sp.]